MALVSPQHNRPLSGNALKIIAIAAMFLDHIGAAILENHTVWAALGADLMSPELFNDPALAGVMMADLLLRGIGRISFPIFCFLLVEGFLHTKSLPLYLRRMAVFAVITEVPFDLAFCSAPFDFTYQNIFFTLLLGLLAMAALQKFGDRSLVGFLLALGCAGVAEVIRADYGAFGVVLIIILYLFRDRRLTRTIVGCIAVCWELTAPLAFLLIELYNGQRGRYDLKYFFYVFYPAHILLLYLVRVALVGG